MRIFLAGLAAGALALCAGYALASRNSSGTMSAANGPYISGSVISSSVVNARFADIENELTDSLSRSGKGGMTAPLREADGTVASPSISFTSEPGTGLYRVGAGDLGVAVNGVKSQEWTSTGASVPGTFAVTGTLDATGQLTTHGLLSTPGGIDSPGNAIFDGNLTVIGSTSAAAVSATTVAALTSVTTAALTATGSSSLSGGVTIGSGIGTNGSGFKHQSVVGCTTAASLASPCNTVLTWSSAFADTSYQPICSCGSAGAGSPVLGQVVVSSAAAITITTVTLIASASQCSVINCFAAHN